jgi:hypothetical protein
MASFRLSLNITEDWDLICLFHNLRSPTPTALCRNVLDAYLSGQSVQMPVVDLEARVPKDAKKIYWITLTDEQTEFLSSFDARRRSSVVRLLLRRGLWEYCLKLLGMVETVAPEGEVKHHTNKTDVRSTNFNSEPRKGSDVRSTNFNSSSSLRENEDDKPLRHETKCEQESTPNVSDQKSKSVSGTNPKASFLGSDQGSKPVGMKQDSTPISALDLFNSIIGEEE